MAGVARFSEGLRDEALRLGVRVTVVEAGVERPAEEVAQAIVAAAAQPPVSLPSGRQR
jgi:hypothetical protein